MKPIVLMTQIKKVNFNRILVGVDTVILSWGTLFQERSLSQPLEMGMKIFCQLCSRGPQSIPPSLHPKIENLWPGQGQNGVIKVTLGVFNAKGYNTVKSK